MNERILELAREAGLLVHNPTGVPTKLEKFAQLIVRECVKVTLESIYHNGIGDVNDCIIVGNDVAEHFGVKE